ncbi:hypothetical protein V5G65_10765 [Mammaliicoccus sciuri]|uniref:hypothetical protein n=1 Tax=Mammaliicoccus sciuri TaxID=1296 RepID=UPI00378A6CD1
MKKLLSICLGVIILLCACGQDNDKSSNNDKDNKEHDTFNTQKDTHKEPKTDPNYEVTEKDKQLLKNKLDDSTNAFGKIINIDTRWIDPEYYDPYNDKGETEKDDRQGEDPLVIEKGLNDDAFIIYSGKNLDLFVNNSRQEVYSIKKIYDNSFEAVVAKRKRLDDETPAILKNSKITVTYIDDDTIKVKKDNYPEEILHSLRNHSEDPVSY